MVAGLSHLWKTYPQMISKPDKKDSNEVLFSLLKSNYPKISLTAP